MQQIIDKVKEFHLAFDHPVGVKPNIPDGKLCNLRASLMQEENKEYLDACIEGDMVEVADALGDMLYILAGTILAHGMQHKIVEVFDEIHRSNMSKLGEDGQPIYREDGKVLKGPNYFKPDLKSIVTDDNS